MSGTGKRLLGRLPVPVPYLACLMSLFIEKLSTAAWVVGIMHNDA